MKYSILLLFVLAASLVSAQSPVKRSEVPASVLKSYSYHNSGGSKDSVWSKQTVSMYTVKYTDEGKQFESVYAEDGIWIKTVRVIPQSELPGMVGTQMSQLYPGYVITKATVELNNDGKFYALDIAKDKNEMVVYFLMSGKFVK